MKNKVKSGNRPKGSSFGKNPNRKSSPLIYFDELLEIGGRAQRRWAMRMFRRGQVKPMEDDHGA